MPRGSQRSCFSGKTNTQTKDSELWLCCSRCFPFEGCLSSTPAQHWGCRGWRPALRGWAGLCTCQNTFCFSKVSSQSKAIGKAPQELLHYLESGPEAMDVAGVTQGCLQGVGDHAAHAAPGALGHPGRLGVSDQGGADSLRQQLWVSKDENPVGTGGWGKREVQIHHH